MKLGYHNTFRTIDDKLPVSVISVISPIKPPAPLTLSASYFLPSTS